jgi:hypothetical protein
MWEGSSFFVEGENTWRRMYYHASVYKRMFLKGKRRMPYIIPSASPGLTTA